jgi:hypothetical protein
MRRYLMIALLSTLPLRVVGQAVTNEKYGQLDKFRQLEEILPTPSDVRTASGRPGHEYWQQNADYEIDVELDDKTQSILGSEAITYTNRSPDPLNYLWLQLDTNIFAKDSDAHLSSTAPDLTKTEMKAMEGLLLQQVFDGGIKITHVNDDLGNPLPHSIIKTMMRIDLPKPLVKGESTKISIGWNYKINDAKLIMARTGFEYFDRDKNYIYEIAHWFPRMAAYTDTSGWQHKQYLGQGEFTLEFGNYLVRITVPDDHVVGATGVLLNQEEVLSPLQIQRLDQARSASKPTFIVTPEEAKTNESHLPVGKKTWIYKADDVRDFAFASSRKFIWDAQLHRVEGNEVMAMSLYPNEAEPLWSKYSTHAIIHTLDVYSKYTFRYPYPTAISVNGPVGGMEYPMICFNGPRPEEDKTYSKRTKYGLISVIIHEVGHNFFPMIVNSDERQWTWMDEGINTFLQYLAEQEWEEGYPSFRGNPKDIVEYMKSTHQVPIMTNSESILQFGNNAYAKPATALNILRETVLGRELFDFAFKEYARRWMFKRPQPADLFRTIEDASGVDLDWFWHGWFYTTDHVDISLDDVRLFSPSTEDPDIDKAKERKERDAQPITKSDERNKAIPKRVEQFPELKDFFNDYDKLNVSEKDRKAYEKFVAGLTDKEKQLLKSSQYFYFLDFSNRGGLVMPILLKISYADGSSEEWRAPAEIWRYNHRKVSKLLVRDKEIQSIELDPHLETADTERSNNHFPRKIVPSRFKLFKEEKMRNEMQESQTPSEPMPDPAPATPEKVDSEIESVKETGS